MRSGQLMYPPLSAQFCRDRRASAWRSEFCIGAGQAYQPRTDHSVHEPAPLTRIIRESEEI
jgi:hypothetical protein